MANKINKKKRKLWLGALVICAVFISLCGLWFDSGVYAAPKTISLEVLETKRPKAFALEKNLFEILKTLKPNAASVISSYKFKKTAVLKRGKLISAICSIEKWQVKKQKKNPYKDILKAHKLAPCVAYATVKGYLAPFKDISNKKFKINAPVKRKELAGFLRALYKKPVKRTGGGISIPEQEEAIVPKEETPEPIPQFTPIAPAFISKTFFDNLTLKESIPNTFYKGEKYIIEGETLASYKKVFVFLIPEGKTEEAVTQTFLGEINNTSFQVPVIFRKPGNYELGIVLTDKDAGKSRIAQISVLAEISSFESQAQVSPPEQMNSLSYSYTAGKTLLKWNRASGDAVKIVFSGAGGSVNYILRGQTNSFEPIPIDFIKIQEGNGIVVIKTAYADISSPEIRLRSGWSESQPLQIKFTEKGFRTISENLTVNELKETFEKGRQMIFKGSAEKILSNKAAITLPNGKVEFFKVKEALELGEEIPVRQEISVSFAFNEEGIYIFELNDPDGGAILNVPLYVGKQLFPILPDFFAKNENIALSTETFNLNETRQTMLGLINKARDNVGAEAISSDNSLHALAQKHSEDMVRRNFFSHYNPDGKGPDDRRVALKIPMYVHENLAKGPSIELAHEGLMRSPIHRHNILNEKWDRVGLGIIKDAEGNFIITQEFAEPPFTNESLISIKNDLLQKIQDKRASNGFADLIADSKLEELSAAWSSLMVEDGFFDFQAPDGTKLVNRIRNAGIKQSIQTFILQSGDIEKLWEGMGSQAPLSDGAFLRIGIGISLDDLGMLYATVIYSK